MSIPTDGEAFNAGWDECVATAADRWRGYASPR